VTFRPLRLRTQAFLSLVGVLAAVVLAGTALVAMSLRRNMEEQFELRALAIARTVAADPDLVSAVLARDEVEVQRRAEAVRRRTGALFVVVTDVHGIRLSHPNPELIGQLVSTDPGPALAGHEVTAMQQGTLGLSARGKVPLRAPDGSVRGVVSVGISATEVTARSRELLGAAVLFAGLALAVGTFAAALFARRLKRQTMGLEPADLAELLREREAVLHGVADGVLAVDTAGRITVCTAEASRLLGCEPSAGVPLAEAGLPAQVADVLAHRRAIRGEVAVLGDKAVLLTAHLVRRDGRDLGHVVTLRDRSRLDDLNRELDAVRAFSDALRAQSHEYTNRLHTLAGMLQLGHAEEALDYLRELAADPLAADTEGIAAIRDPYLRGLLVAKRAAAAERGVTLELIPESRLPGVVRAPLDVVTVLGNLIDNGVRAAAEGRLRPARVDVSVTVAGRALHLGVADTGNGVAPERRELVFADGFTTTRDDARSHGIGLALARQVARSHGGDVTLTDPGGPEAGHGALFIAVLPSAVQFPAEPRASRGTVAAQEIST